MVRWMGVIRDRTDKFKSLKDGKTTHTSSKSLSHENSRELRFKPISNNIMNLEDSDDDDLEQHIVKIPAEREVSISSGDNTLNDDYNAGVDVRNRSNYKDEENSYKTPFWILCKDEIDENLKNVEVKFEKLKLLERRRVNEIFKTGEGDDIQFLVEEITTDIRFNDEKLKEIRNYKAISNADMKIKDNVEIVVAKKLLELTQSLRQRQRNYVGKYSKYFPLPLNYLIMPHSKNPRTSRRGGIKNQSFR
jgi:hypothetical protein